MKLYKKLKIFLLIIIAFAAPLFSCSEGEPRCAHTDLSSEMLSPTCDRTGGTRSVCTDCGETFMTDLALPTGHEYEVTTVPPSCDEPGYDIYSCSACGIEYKSNHSSPLGHTLSITETPPTCNTEGYKTAECQVCKYTFTYDTVAPTGHVFSKSTQNVSAENQVGSTTYTCHCGFSYVGDYRFYSDVFKGAYIDNTEILAKGIDVSYHNHNLAADGSRLPLDWAAIRKSGYEFAILRAGYRNRADVCFEMNYAAAKASGLELGAYFYSYATSAAEARAEALFCLELLKGKQFEYPIFFDVEDSSIEKLGKDTVTEICVTFISILQEHGYYAAIYTNNNWLVNILHTQKITALFDVWYARYVSTSSVITEARWDSEKYGKQMAMWQFSQTGVIDGFTRPDGTPIYFDLNYAYKDYPTLIKKLGYNGY